MIPNCKNFTEQHVWREIAHFEVIEIRPEIAEKLIDGREVNRCYKCKMLRQSGDWEYFPNS